MIADSVTNGIPIIAHVAVQLDAVDRRRLHRLAHRILRHDAALASTAAFGPRVRPGLGRGTRLLIEDHHAIRLFELQGNREYSYRALLLAGEGDQLVLGARRSPSFEQYCAQTLGFGRVEVLEPRGARTSESLSLRCLGDTATFDRIVAYSAAQSGIDIVPYMGTGGVWALAGAVAARSGIAVRVAAAAPKLTRCVNDKLWFASLLDEVFGRQAHPANLEAFGSTALAACVAALSAVHPTVVVKLRDSASGKGNLVLQSKDLAGRTLSQLRTLLLEAMRASGWHREFPLLVSAWESPVLVSPSAQLWIPATEQGNPVVEGIFEQRFLGSNVAFAGAVPCHLPTDWQREFAYQALKIGTLLQGIGYFGRCSLDAIVLGDELANAKVHWIECNGRWGGVSIPMTLANRLLGDWQRKSIVIVERTSLARPRRNFADVLHLLRDCLYVGNGQTAGAVMLSPTPIEDGTGFSLLALGPSPEAAAEVVQEIDTRLRSA